MASKFSAHARWCATALALFVGSTALGAAPEEKSDPAPAAKDPAEKKTPVQVARERLLASGKTAGLDVKRLESLTGEFEGRASQYWLSDAQIVSAYEQLDEILSAPKPGPFYSKDEL